MSVFIDSGYFIAFADKRDSNHKRAMEISESLSAGTLGASYISDYIFDEVVTYTLVKAKSAAKAIGVGERILNSEIRPLGITKDVFDASWKLFQQRKNLSFTDCTTVEAMKANSIKKLITFDKGLNQFKNEINILK